MLKKFLILCIALTFVACGGDDNDAETPAGGTAGEGGMAGAAGGAAGEGGEAGETGGAAGEGGEAGVTAGPGCPTEGDDERIAAACAWLADCAVNAGLCPAYTEGDTESQTGVEAGCIEAASAALTNLACVHTSCDQTIGLANSANADFAAACSGEGGEGGEAGEGGEGGEGGAVEVTYCERYTAACGDWTEETSCADWWAASPAGTDGDASGATQACYSYHLSVAEMQEDGSAERTEHCGHSMGMAPCVD